MSYASSRKPIVTYDLTRKMNEDDLISSRMTLEKKVRYITTIKI